MEEIRITYREYTTAGRLVMANTIVTDTGELPELIREMFAANDSLNLVQYYRDRGFLSHNESLKPLWLTNVVVRGDNGKFLPFSHFL